MTATERDFIPLNLCVLTVSDSRTLAEDSSGDYLVQALTRRRPSPRRTRTAARRPLPAARRGLAVDRRRRRRRHPGHRRHRLHRPRLHARSAAAAARQADARLRRTVPRAQLRRDRHLARCSRARSPGWPTARSCSRCPARPRPAAPRGRRSSARSSMRARGRATWPRCGRACKERDRTPVHRRFHHRSQPCRWTPPCDCSPRPAA